MATFPLGIYFVIGATICCVVSTVWSDTHTEADVIQELVNRLHRVEAMQRTQQTELTTQKRINEEQARTIADLNNRLNDHCECNKMADDEPSDESSSIQSGISTTNTSTSDERVDGTEVTAKPYRQGIYKRQSPESGVSFSVYLDHDVDIGQHIGQHQTVKFNKIITNEGGAYNNQTGVFTCPIDGVYMFTFFVGERDTNQVMVQLVVNSQPTVHAVVEGFHTAQDLQGGNAVIKRLVTGDVVWIELVVGPHIDSDNTHRLTTFSGILMYN